MTRIQRLAPALIAAMLSAAVIVVDAHAQDRLKGYSLSQAAPRLEAQLANIELVAVVREHNLTIYVGDRVRNIPVSGAKIDVSLDGVTVRAREEGEGIYNAPADPLRRIGRHEIGFTIRVDGRTEIVAGTIDVPLLVRKGAEESSAWQPPYSGASLAAAGAASFGLGVLTTLFVMRRRSRSSHGTRRRYD